MIRSFLVKFTMILIALMPVIALSAEHIPNPGHNRFSYLTTNDGLPQNTIDCILKDSRGFMWFGTWDGLCRYDGYSFKTYKRSHALNSLPDNFIYSMCEDSTGNIWIGTGRGLVYFNYSNETFQIPPGLLESVGKFSITHIVQDHKQRLWIATKNNGLWLVEYDESRRLFSTKIDGKFLPDRHVNYLCLLNDRNLLAGTDKGMGFINLNNSEPVQRWNRLISMMPEQQIQTIFQDSQNNIWIGTETDGLYRYNTGNLQLSYFGADDNLNDDLNHFSVSTIIEDLNGTIIVGTLGGLNFFNASSNNFTHLNGNTESLNDLNNPFVNSMFSDDLGNVWIGTEKGGVNYYNTYQKPFFSLQHEKANPKSLSHNTINSLLKEDGVLWIGTAGGGLNKVMDVGNQVHRYEFNPNNRNGINNNFVTSILRDWNGNLWIGTWGGGINQLISEKQNRFAVLSHIESDDNSPSSNFISSLMKLDNKRILVGTLGGLDVFEPTTKSFIHVHENMTLANPLEVGCQLMDTKDRIWIGTRYGLYRFERKSLCELSHGQKTISYSKFLHHPEDTLSLPGDYIISMLEDSKGTIWVGTYGNGICKYVENTDTAYFESYTEKDGLCNNATYAIEEDLQGNLWISTDNGLSRFNPEQKTFRNFYVKDGLLSNQFYWSASCTDNNGTLYFGGINGLNYFFSKDIELYPNSPQPVFTEFSIFNSPVKIGESYHSKVILSKPIGESDQLELSYKDAVISIEFSALDYFLPEKIQYEYKMHGLNQDWVRVPSSRRIANYTNLAGGKYLFQVRASNSDGVWSDKMAELEIVVVPPFWQTFLFQILITLVLALLIFSYIRYRMKFLNDQKKKLEIQVGERTHKIEEQKEELQIQAENLQKTNKQLADRQILIEGQKIELENQNTKILSQRDEVIELNEKVKLVNQLRLRFFTNISHEFRTPLTLIIDPLEQLMANFKGDKNSINTLHIINRNAQRLLHLINQLIYFRRIESGKLKLRISKGNFSEFMIGIFNSFNDLAIQQDINYQHTIINGKDECWFDSEKTENIFYNLISNSFKFTPPKGQIRMAIEFVEEDTNEKFQSPYVCIKIEDTGRGISKADLPYIFDRFFQAETDNIETEKTSSGIGLALTNELVKALNGELRVESKINEGSCFSVFLPYTKERFNPDEITETSIPAEVNLEGRIDVLAEHIVAREYEYENDEMQSDKSKALVLVVEDNFDLRTFLLHTLKTDYNTIGAENGREGLAMAKKYSPELILSDVMMPEMDGIELCSRLKKDIQTSHIPIILLTAKNIVESWVEGLETGADDYIPKPFNLQILMAKMNNLIQSRKKLKLMFSTPTTANPSELTSNSIDETFIKKAYEILEANYTEAEFSVNQFAQEMFVSRSLLYKKIKAITDLNITEFINTFKLKKSIDLIHTTNQSIAEIAYNSGFNDPKYFSRIFRKFYGMSPSNFTEKKD